MEMEIELVVVVVNIRVSDRVMAVVLVSKRT